MPQMHTPGQWLLHSLWLLSLGIPRELHTAVRDLPFEVCSLFYNMRSLKDSRATLRFFVVYTPTTPSILHQEVQSLLALSAIEEVISQQRKKRFSSSKKKKKSEGFELFWDVKGLNTYIKRFRFRMVSMASSIPSLDHHSAINLQDSYVHSTIH